ncbi:H-NS family nucleoid-associated regulatory protein [Photobacterium nomapromontoriensis]|uniref:H-NS family histone-like protein n=1 Tax=Photobacterium nomapromontoriensis TaxID=2910237 RepID=UPI003D0FEA1D
MTDAIKLLMNIRSLRAFARESMTLEQLQEALEKLNQVVNERTAEEEQAKASNKEHEEKLEAYRQMLLSDGIDPEELLDMTAKAPKKTRAVRQAKYMFTDENGEEKTWTGQGRTPSTLKNALDAGASLDEFLI